nr:hypothetical protein [Tanacetum cinerariifolium]
MLAPRSSKARYSTEPTTVHGIRKLSGSPSLDSLDFVLGLGGMEGMSSQGIVGFTIFRTSRRLVVTLRRWVGTSITAASASHLFHFFFDFFELRVDLCGKASIFSMSLESLLLFAKETVLRMGLSFMSLEQSGFKSTRSSRNWCASFEVLLRKIPPASRIACVASSSPCSLNHTLASSTKDDGKSLSLIASALVVPYRNIPQNLDEYGDVLVRIGPRTSIKLAVFDHRKVMTFNGEVVSKVNRNDSCPRSGYYGSVVSPHSRAAETTSRAAGGDLVFARDEPAGSDSQSGSSLVRVEIKLKNL